ncbi:MAG: hypothetical protein L0Z55_03860 [Planctomycetes bacterium]|nr:hypothetical protein [Planctomycetota bacterium]
MIARLCDRQQPRADGDGTPVSRVREYLRARASVPALTAEVERLRADLRTLLARIERVRRRGGAFAAAALSESAREAARSFQRNGARRIYFEPGRNRA